MMTWTFLPAQLLLGCDRCNAAKDRPMVPEPMTAIRSGFGIDMEGMINKGLLRQE
jgi:hypothetical protein